MQQLVKGGKWVFGWIIVSPGGEVQIPPNAFAEYGFSPVSGCWSCAVAGARTGLALGDPQDWRKPICLCNRSSSDRQRSAQQGRWRSRRGLTCSPATAYWRCVAADLC